MGYAAGECQGTAGADSHGPSLAKLLAIRRDAKDPFDARGPNHPGSSSGLAADRRLLNDLKAFNNRTQN